MNGAWLADPSGEGSPVERLPSIVGVFETMRVVVSERGARLPLWTRHIDRMIDGAHVLDMPQPSAFDRLRHELLEMLHGTDQDLRLRLSYGRLGQDPVFGASWEPAPAAQSIVRLHLSAERVDETFPRHPRVKATRREFYDRIQRRARAVGADEGLCVTEDGRVLETAIGNLFFERDGQWFTPPSDTGVPIVRGVCHDLLIAGLADRGLRVERRAPTLDELSEADACYVTNALRGPRPALLPGTTAKVLRAPSLIEELWSQALADRAG